MMELKRKIVVGGISPDTTEDRLREYFQGFGEVVEAAIMKDPITSRPRGFGFVVFADSAIVGRVVMEKKHLIEGHMVRVKRFVLWDDLPVLCRSTPNIHDFPGPARTKKIFVRDLASTVTVADFRNYFEQYGAITNVVLMYDNTQRPKGFGFIAYESEDSVDMVLRGTYHELNGRMAEVKRVMSKSRASL